MSTRASRLSSMFGVARAAAALSLVLGVVGGCEDKAAAPAPAPVDKAAQAPKAPEKPKADFSGVIKGIVKLAEGAELPLAPVPKEKVVDPAKPCRPFAEDDRRIVSKFAGTGGLTPIHIAITQMKAAPEHKPATHTLFVRNCRLTPALVGAQAGDTLRIVNESDAPFMPVLPGDAFMRGLLKGESREIKLERLGPSRVACGFAGYCGESTVITVAHPLFAVTDERGEFTIKGVPLDQDILVHAGHALFEVSTVQAKLSKAEPEKTLEFVIKPASASGAKPFEVRPEDRPKKPGDAAAAKAPGKGEKPAPPPARDPIK